MASKKLDIENKLRNSHILRMVIIKPLYTSPKKLDIKNKLRNSHILRMVIIKPLYTSPQKMCAWTCASFASSFLSPSLSFCFVLLLTSLLRGDIGYVYTHVHVWVWGRVKDKDVGESKGKSVIIMKCIIKLGCVLYCLMHNALSLARVSLSYGNSMHENCVYYFCYNRTHSGLNG